MLSGKKLIVLSSFVAYSKYCVSRILYYASVVVVLGFGVSYRMDHNRLFALFPDLFHALP